MDNTGRNQSIATMKYKPGDKVKIKSLEWYNANKNSEGVVNFNNLLFFDELMSEFCGKVVTIEHCNTKHNDYDIEEDGKVNLWSDEMIEGLADEPQEKMVSLDKVCSWIDDADISKYLSCIFSGAANISFRSDDFIRDLKKAMGE